MSDILLINPRITSRRRARFPLSIMALAAALRGRYETMLMDGNLVDLPSQLVSDRIRNSSFKAVGITVMGGPQVATAIEASRAIRDAHPRLPIIWGGYFPTLYPNVAMNCDYVDFVVRGQGEDALIELLNALDSDNHLDFSQIKGLTWRINGQTVNNIDRAFSKSHLAPAISYDQLPNAYAYAVETFLGKRTVAYQAALGCRFRCTFCGVAAMFEGATALPPADRLDQDLSYLKHEIKADSIQFYDHNFFDREVDTIPLLEVLADHQMAWWCYARADALLGLSPDTWKLVRRSNLRMAYIGAETSNDSLLKSIRKGTKAQQTLDVARICRDNGIIPELSFMVAPPDDAERETERTFDFIRKVKRVNPEAEIIIYVYTPPPAESIPNASRLDLPELVDETGKAIQFPRSPDEWTEQRWVDYACHTDAPWVNERLRRRIADFVTVLRCRFPTVQDTRSPDWAKLALRGLASWRYAIRHYDRPWELTASHRLIGLLDPRVTSI